MNVFRGRALDGVVWDYILSTPIKLRILKIYAGESERGGKLHAQEGNSPDRRLRSLNQAKWERR